MKRISDKDIARFFEKYQDEIIQMELSDLPTDEELSQVHIPAEYDRRIEQLIDDYSHQSKKATHTGRRIAIAILAALIAATVTVMSVSASREWFFKVISQVFPTHTQIDAFPAESLQDDVPFVAYAPRYLPDGYVMDGKPHIREPLRFVRIVYRNGSGGLIRFNQMFEGGMHIDTEEAYTETVQINGRDALYVQKGVTQMLYGYIDNTLFFLYARDPELTKDEVLAIAQSIAPIT